MKSLNTFFKVAAGVLFILAGSTQIKAQNITMSVMKNGVVIYTTTVDEVEKIIFQQPEEAEDVLQVHKKDGTPAEETPLTVIENLTLSGGNLSVIPVSGIAAVYPVNKVAKLTFKDSPTTGVTTPTAAKIEAYAHFDAQGNIAVECEAGILSLALFTVDGRIITTQHNGAAVQYASFQQSNMEAGIYLLRIETPLGTTVKKVIKSSKN